MHDGLAGNCLVDLTMFDDDRLPDIFAAAAVLVQARLRSGSRKNVADPIELGNEPPLSVDGSHCGPIDRRRLSVQWFSGTILTGLCGAALMGGAVFASLDGETNFAAAPQRFESALRGAFTSLGDRITGGLHKTDRLPSQSEANIQREVLRVPTVTRSNFGSAARRRWSVAERMTRPRNGAGSTSIRDISWYDFTFKRDAPPLPLGCDPD